MAEEDLREKGEEGDFHPLGKLNKIEALDRFGMPIDGGCDDNSMGFGVRMGEGIFPSKTPISKR